MSAQNQQAGFGTVAGANAADPEIERRLATARSDIRKLRTDCEAMIFGSSQKFGIRVVTNAFFVRTQLEMFGRPVAAVLLVGKAGAGKTAFADAIFRKFRNNDRLLLTKVTGMGDMTPGQFTGHLEFITVKNGDDVRFEKVHREGYIAIGRNFLILDELLRTNQELFNAFGHIFAEGKIVLGSNEIDIAPPQEPFIVIATANPPGSSGTRTPGQFFVDRITAAAIFRTEWNDDAYLHSLLAPNEHWNAIYASGAHRPIFEPRRLTEIQALVDAETKTAEHEQRYLARLIRAFLALSEPRWAEAEWFRGKPLPERWNALKHLPFHSLLKEPGGRMPQHFEALARMDSFFTYGSCRTVVPAVQAMAHAVFSFRVMCGLADGGMDVLDAAYGGEDILQFTDDLIDWLVRSVRVDEE